MTSGIGPWVFGLFLWWFGTGLLLYVDRRQGLGRRGSLVVATALAGAAFAGVFASRDMATPVGALVAFTCAVGIWGWLEMTFLRGIVTGPRRAPCPGGISEGRRFALAVQVLLYHELLTLVLVAALFALTAHHPNDVAAWTFAVLWLMRISSKLNIFLGVPRFNVEFLPQGMRYITGYGRVRRLNLLFPVSVTAGTAVAAVLLEAALAVSPGSYEYTALALVNAMLILAVLEHWFLVLPVEDAALWRWVLPGTPGGRADRGSRDGQAGQAAASVATARAPLAGTPLAVAETRN